MQERSEEQEGVDKERQKVAQGISASLSLANIEGVGVDQRKTQLAYELIEKGDLAGAKVIQSNLADSIKSAVEMKKQQRNELEGQRQAIEGSADLAAKIDRFITPQGKVTPILDDATGFGEGAGTFLGKMTGGVVGNEPKTISAQQVLNRIVEKDLLEASKYLKPVSDDEMKMLKKNRPQITDPPEVWAEYLGDIRAVLKRDQERWQRSIMELAPPSSSQAQSTSEQTTPEQQPTTQLQHMNKYFQGFTVQ